VQAPELALDAGGDDATPPVVFDAGPPDADPPDAQPLTIGLSTLAGGAEPGWSDGARNVARFDDPVNVAVAPDGIVFVADFNNNTIRRVTEDGHTITFTRQTGFARPFGITFAPTGLYVETDRNSQNQDTGALWKVNGATGIATLLKDDVGRVRGMDVLSDGRLVLSDFQAHIIRLYDPATGALTDLAGKQDTPGYAEGQGANARFDVPYDLVVAKVGATEVILVSDQKNHRIRQIRLDGTVSTFAGDSVGATRDGALAQARFIEPQGLARASDGTLFVSDPVGHVIRRIQGNQVSTIAGDGMAGYVDNLDPLMARFYGLEGIDVSNDGMHLYIADGNLGEDEEPYHRVRRVEF
jgi:hypothetical protein